MTIISPRDANGPSRREGGFAWTTKRRWVFNLSPKPVVMCMSRMLSCSTPAGKSCLLDRYITGIFEGQAKNTIGAAFAAKKVCAVLTCHIYLQQ